MPSRSNAVITSGRPSSQAFASAAAEKHEAALRHIGEQRIAVAEMAIRRSRAHPGQARGIGERESGRTFLGDQFKRGAHQGFFQIAVVIAARAALAPSHVKGLYMNPRPIASLKK